MKDMKFDTEPLYPILQKYGKDQPSAQFSKRLKYITFQSYKVKYSVVYKKEERLGKWIIAMVIVSCLLIIYQMNPSHLVAGMMISCSAFVLGIFVVILILKKTMQNKFTYISTN
ncbi:hypothetical protein [Pedobacter antarcticus]|uniref:hypothetical protein n=1 Tax=Pedobacter antarcticus TaxID=34086 RepID=UPI0008886EE0|nr:hypothetical protein [Pedobacter antarcticus]SDM26633.1 hypothetical protein SAMN04488084_10547 [Pedobacter antarcticus]